MEAFVCIYWGHDLVRVTHTHFLMLSAYAQDRRGPFIFWVLLGSLTILYKAVHSERVLRNSSSFPVCYTTTPSFFAK